MRHTLRGCVDWNLCDVMRFIRMAGHTLRGCVDWNPPKYWTQTLLLVTPCVGVWIETASLQRTVAIASSHPAWVCGLKHIYLRMSDYHLCHTLRGCVDWNFYSIGYCIYTKSHTLRGCVDWNYLILYLHFLHQVTPCVGVWIETIVCKLSAISVLSHPAWVCGLKH